MTREWTELTIAAAAALPGQLGVYEMADREGVVVAIGYAGGNEPFGLRSALASELENHDGAELELQFRVEYTHAYLTRWQELLMRHHAEHGELPPANSDDQHLLGRLSSPGRQATKVGR